MNLIEAIILAIVEGLTEFLPVSSTGHMILVSAMMGIHHDEFVKSFEIIIQLAAILSVIVIYYKRFLVSLDIYFKLGIGVIPFGILGYIFKDYIKGYLFNPTFVSFTLIIGGIVLIFFDKWTEKKESKFESVEKISYKQCLLVGIFQCFALFPGVSRAAATIFGGLIIGFNRKQAAEYSFLLAVPTMCGVTGVELLEHGKSFNQDQYTVLIIGGIVSFIFALLAIKTFIALISKYGFTLFGYYRIAVGVLFLLLSWYMGIQMPTN